MLNAGTYSVEKFVGIFPAENEGRTYLQHVVIFANAANQYAGILKQVHKSGCFGRRGLLGLTIADKFHADPQSFTPNVSDQGLAFGKACETPADVVADFFGIVDKMLLFDNVQHRAGSGGRRIPNSLFSICFNCRTVTGSDGRNTALASALPIAK